MQRDRPTIFVQVGAPDGQLQRVQQKTHDDQQPAAGEQLIESMSYEDDDRKADKLTLTVDAFDLSAIDSPLWRKGNLLVVQWGYSGRMSPPRDMVIQSAKGGRKLKIEALDKGILLNKKQKRRTFENVKRSDVARIIAMEQGFIGPQMLIQDTEEVLEQVTQARMTDGQLLRDMARREGYDWFVDFDGFHFHERDLGQKPLRTYIYYTDPGEGDVMSFTLDNDLSASKPGRVRLQGRNPFTKEDIDEVGDNDTTSDRHTLADVIDIVSEVDGTKHAEPLAKTTATEIVMPTTEKTKKAAARQAKGMYKRAQMTAIEMTVRAVGDAWQVAKSIVGAERFGSTLSGLYYVKTVKHDLGKGYVMSMKWRRDGKSRATSTTTAFDELPGQGRGVRSGGAKNNKKADDANGKGGGTGDQDQLGTRDVVDPVTGQKRTIYVDFQGREFTLDAKGNSVETDFQGRPITP